MRSFSLSCIEVTKTLVMLTMMIGCSAILQSCQPVVRVTVVPHGTDMNHITSLTPSPMPPLVTVFAPTAEKNLAIPPLFFIADEQLYQQTRDKSEWLADLSALGEILDAVSVADNVFVLSSTGISRVEVSSKRVVETAVTFDEQPLFGALLKTSNPDILLYSIAVESLCEEATGRGTEMGLYRIAEDELKGVYATERGYVYPLGTSSDQKSIYGLPIGCDPGFDSFWVISTDNGKVTEELYTWDTEPKEYGWAYATLSPDMRSIAFMSDKFIAIEKPLAYGLSVYNLDDKAIGRYQLPNSPSSIEGGLVWSKDNQTVYFLLNAGLPGEADQKSYGLWSLNTHTGEFLQITKEFEQYAQLRAITPDGKWLLFQAGQTIGYINLSTGEQVNVPIAIRRVKMVFP